MLKGQYRMLKRYPYSYLLIEIEKILKLIENSTYLKLVSATNLAIKPNNSYNRKDDNFYEIAYVTSGNGSMIIDDISNSLKPGQFFFISNNLKYTIRNSIQKNLTLIHITFNIIKYDPHQTISLKINPFCYSTIPGLIQKYKRLFEMALSYNTDEAKIEDRILHSSILSILISEIYKTILYRKEHPIIKDERITKIKAMIVENKATTMTVPQLASIANLSTKYFTKLFKEQVGYSPKEFILLTKINYATKLLELGKYRINEIALLLGYSDSYAFSKQYKKSTGITPSKVHKKTRDD